jgi:purine-binding chemotaxis protein CheW
MVHAPPRTPMHPTPHHNGAPASTPDPLAQALGIREYLTFRLGDESYGIDILRVQEIRSFEPPTRLANAPDMVLGVIDLRGVIVPLIDLRQRLGMAPAAAGTVPVVIVLDLGGATTGVVVDAVSDVVMLQPDQVRPAPQMGYAGSSEHLLGIGSLPDRMLILVDAHRLVAGATTGLALSTPH